MNRAVIDSPVGPLSIETSERGLRRLSFDASDPGLRMWALCADPTPDLRRVVAQLREYFAGTRRDFDLPLDLEGAGTDFQVAAWRALADIPYGETVSYGEQARRIGRPDAIRAIGAANGQNPIAIVLPCHRVIGANGSLTGFGGGLQAKRTLLDLEQGVASLM